MLARSYGIHFARNAPEREGRIGDSAQGERCASCGAMRMKGPAIGGSRPLIDFRAWKMNR
jgi:hypothetical protein